MAVPISDPQDAQWEYSPPGWTPLMDAMPQGVMLLDATGRYLAVNAAAGQILGLSNQALLASGLPEPWTGLCAADGTPLPAEAFPGRVALRDAAGRTAAPFGWKCPRNPFRGAAPS